MRRALQRSNAPTRAQPRARRTDALRSLARLSLALSIALALPACRGGETAPPPPIHELEQLDVEDAGKRLMRSPLGLSRLDDHGGSPTTAVIAVHGYKSRGKEWITPLANLARDDVAVYFYRWRDTTCPKKAVPVLKDTLAALLERSPDLERIIVVGHSYGGLITGLMAQQFSPENHAPAVTEMDVHMIAAPLASVPLLEGMCSFHGIEETHPRWKSTTWHLWRTVHEQDGAFKHLADDPQEVALPRLEMTRLPSTLESGERLGHNRSLTWVSERLRPLTPTR